MSIWMRKTIIGNLTNLNPFWFEKAQNKNKSKAQFTWYSLLFVRKECKSNFMRFFF